MNEAETRAEHIDPALKAAGWGVVDGSRIRREHPITLGRIEGQGKRSKPLTADYVLEYRNTKLAVIEAKAWGESLTLGVAQAKNYAEKMAVRFAYSSNGHGIYAIDMQTGREGDLLAYPTPDELWKLAFAEANAWRDRFAAVPTPDKSGQWSIRFYQETSVNRVLEAIENGRDRILLTLATGTGKTSIAFQVAWKLFNAKWNLIDWKSGADPTRRPRILFLADRNTLADQAYNDFNSFAAFPEDALRRIKPDEIRENGRVPTNANIFFTIFQTFMSGPANEGAALKGDGSASKGGPALKGHGFSRAINIEHEGAASAAEGYSGQHPAPKIGQPYFGQYPPDFFDFIVIDECHRGGANDEGNWRGIMEYFAPAVQLGLTATPRRKENADTYLYFGEPVFIYSLKDGINDGFLTPFRVKQIATTLDDYTYTTDDMVVEGEVESGKLYTEKDFNKIIEIREREKHRVKLFMEQINQKEKTLVFCATQDHALIVRDLINQIKTSTDPHYCERVTANDGEIGNQHLRAFQDNEKTLPTILTTSQKLSTGVDARNIRNIVLMRIVGTMIEFKQIIGRGTRLYDGKDYFTIYDFVKAYTHFADPEWDGPPEQPDLCKKCGLYPCQCVKAEPQPCAVCGQLPCECPAEPCAICGQRPCVCQRPARAKIKLADGKERQIQSMMATSFWHPDGTPMSAHQFMESLFGKLPDFFKDEDELRALWSAPDTRKKLLEGLEEKGFGHDELSAMQRLINAEKSDLFDVLAYVAYALPPLDREERAARAQIVIAQKFNDKQQAFLNFVLAHYVSVGVEELDGAKLSPLLNLKYHSLPDALDELGSAEEIRQVFIGFQKYLYQQQQAAPPT